MVASAILRRNACSIKSTNKKSGGSNPAGFLETLVVAGVNPHGGQTSLTIQETACAI
jgi:hypothetical protein